MATQREWAVRMESVRRHGFLTAGWWLAMMLQACGVHAVSTAAPIVEDAAPGWLERIGRTGSGVWEVAGVPGPKALAMYLLLRAAPLVGEDEFVDPALDMAGSFREACAHECKLLDDLYAVQVCGGKWRVRIMCHWVLETEATWEGTVVDLLDDELWRWGEQAVRRASLLEVAHMCNNMIWKRPIVWRTPTFDMHPRREIELVWDDMRGMMRKKLRCGVPESFALDVLRFECEWQALRISISRPGILKVEDAPGSAWEGAY